VWSALGSAGFSRLGLAMVVFLGIAPLFIQDEYVLRLMVVGMLYGAQAIAFDFTAGFINVVNFGFAAFVGAGAYTSAIMATRLGVSPWVGFIFGPIVAGFLGFLTGLLSLRLRGIYAAVMAWFVGLALMGLVIVNVGVTRGQLGLITPLFIKETNQRPYYYIIFPIAIGTYILLSLITTSHIGLAFRAIGQNIDAARASGVNPTKYRVLNFTVSCGLAGLAGVFYAHWVGILTPSMMATKATVEVLALAYIGGRGTLWGGLLAALVVLPIFEYLKPLMEIRLIIYGLFLILSMIFYPKGLAGIYYSIVRRIKKRKESGKHSE